MPKIQTMNVFDQLVNGIWSLKCLWVEHWYLVHITSWCPTIKDSHQPYNGIYDEEIPDSKTYIFGRRSSERRCQTQLLGSSTVHTHTNGLCPQFSWSCADINTYTSAGQTSAHINAHVLYSHHVTCCHNYKQKHTKGFLPKLCLDNHCTNQPGIQMQTKMHANGTKQMTPLVML